MLFCDHQWSSLSWGNSNIRMSRLLLKNWNVVHHSTNRQKQKQSIFSLHTFFCLPPHPCFLPPLISSFHVSCFLAVVLSLFSFFSLRTLFSPAVVFFTFPPSACACDGSIVLMAAMGITELRFAAYESNSANRGWLPLRWHNTHKPLPFHSPQSFIHDNPAISYSEWEMQGE